MRYIPCKLKFFSRKLQTSLGQLTEFKLIAIRDVSLNVYLYCTLNNIPVSLFPTQEAVPVNCAVFNIKAFFFRCSASFTFTAWLSMTSQFVWVLFQWNLFWKAAYRRAAEESGGSAWSGSRGQEQAEDEEPAGPLSQSAVPLVSYHNQLAL